MSRLDEPHQIARGGDRQVGEVAHLAEQLEHHAGDQGQRHDDDGRRGRRRHEADCSEDRHVQGEHPTHRIAQRLVESTGAQGSGDGAHPAMNARRLHRWLRVCATSSRVMAATISTTLPVCAVLNTPRVISVYAS